MSQGNRKVTVYIKADRNVDVEHAEVRLGEVFQLECADAAVAEKLKGIKLYQFQNVQKPRKPRTVVSVLKVIEKIHGVCPNAEVQNLGEADVILSYQVRGKQKHTIGTIAKAGAVMLISFVGAAFSTMAFHNDVNVTKMFGQIYQLLTGTKSDGFTVLEISYCIGIVIGILLFFDHFGKKHFSQDPTPIEVEMRLYENDLQTTLIENISRKEREIDVDP